MVAGQHVGPNLAELLGHELAENRDTHRPPAYEPAGIWENPGMVGFEPGSLEMVLLDIAVIGGLVASIVVGVIALRRRR